MSNSLLTTINSKNSPIRKLPSIFARAKELHVMVLGDSIGAGMSEGQPAIDFANEFSNFGIDATIYSASQGGKRLMGDFMDPTTQTFGPEYDDEVKQNNPDYEKVEVFVDSLLTNDANLLEGGVYTKAEVKTTYQNFIDLRKADPDLPNLRHFFLIPIGRQTVQSSVPWNQAYQDLREIANELAEENTDVYVLGGHFDLDYADSVHLPSAQYSFANRRNAAHISFVEGNSPKTNNGMQLTNVTVTDDGIIADIVHGSGTDFTVPTAGQGIVTTNIIANGNEVTFDSYERVSSNRIKFKSGAPYSGNPIIRPIYGTMQPLGLTNTPFVRDNSSYTMPMQSKVVQATGLQNEPSAYLTGLKYRMKPSYQKTIVSGEEFSSIKSIDNSSFTTMNGDNFEIVDNVFGGVNPGVRPLSNSCGLETDGGLLTGVPQLTALVYDSVADNSDVILFGDPGVPRGEAAVYTDGGDLKCFRADSSPTGIVVTIKENVVGTKFSMIINNVSLSLVEIYIDDASEPVVTFDPQNFVGWTGFFLNGGRGFGNTANSFGLTWAKEGAHDELNDPPLADLMAELNAYRDGVSYNENYLEDGYVEQDYIEGE